MEDTILDRDVQEHEGKERKKRQWRTRRRKAVTPPVLHHWDVEDELEVLRDRCRADFWTFFQWCFGAQANPKGQRWIEPKVHEPLAHWFQTHVDEWLEKRKKGVGEQKHLAVVIHREVGKTTLITLAGQLWLHLRDPELSSYTGGEKTELAMKSLESMKAILDGSDPYSLWSKLYGVWTGSRKWTAREMTHGGRKNISRRDPSLGTFGVETSIVGAHPDAIFYDDPISIERMLTDSDWLKTVNSQVTALFPVVQSDGLIVWVGCIATGTPVLMHDGTWKPIETVKADERVYTTDERGEAAIRRVEASLDQGTAATVVVTTRNATLRCTPWHPFLAEVGGQLAWVRADVLKKGQLVAGVKSSPSDPIHPWMTTDLAWLCGIIMGDGWIGKNADYAAIAMSKHEDLNERIIAVLEDWIPGSMFHRTAFGYVRCNSRAAAEAFRELGLVGSAKTKRVPQWVFRSECEHRVAFLKGFCEADGCKTKKAEDSWRTEIANADLTNDLRLLARTCGVRPGKEDCVRERWLKPPNSRNRVLSRTASSNFNFVWVDQPEWPEIKDAGGPYLRASRAATVLGTSFRLSRVTSVRPAEPCHVWDLTVEGSRSFVANGFVVHNTRYGDDDHFGTAFQHEGVKSLTGMKTDTLTPTEDGKWHVYFMAGKDHDGNPSTPKVWPKRRMDDLQRRDPILFAGQVMNDPSISETNPLTKEQILQCVVKPADVPWNALRFAICCDTAFWDGESMANKDETVFVVHGYPRNGSGDVYVIEGYGSFMWRGEDLAKRLVSTVQRYRKQGRKVFRITDERTRAGKLGTWKTVLSNYFADANEPFPGGSLLEFERGNTKKEARLISAANFWVDGHVRIVEGCPGFERITEQMSKIGQYVVNKRIKIDWADAHSDAFSAELYQPMRRVDPSTAPWEKGSQLIEVDGFSRDLFRDEEGGWVNGNPRPPLR